ncbi:D-(-)-3-hydroxybutyrate oligomer hydrolase [Pseudoxanthomonas indica]|uniref:Hydroxybutyrate-dimer hydrolase n=1 Tax=Pseudoxanthomonas indica TaxID=428993 RepID=A0A1T5IYW6_9GAMM|nr:D-(-)-3-hydroxybutyrate oligomer hydrolase [Pseudoxanthomonas indica]GGD55022.1 D-(-)-3-hydroxybutyrate oligomer hydrolase [Pseudoxanthomonas indica]SKC44133.1 hydroxybutyrate-dimer hydrolase [Pseudoxanthomonas indica]
MMRNSLMATLALALAACSSMPSRTPQEQTVYQAQRITEHRGSDDLLSAGLGLDGLRAMTPPAFADAAAPTALELRRRAIWNNWRGIADLSLTGGYGQVYGSVAGAPGREYSALLRLPQARQPHRVVLQAPDNFDTGKRCLVVTASSGSRGVYGAIAVAGAWALPKGCAVVYTDKGAGTDYFDLDAQVGVGEDGRSVALEQGELAFAPDAPVGASGVAFKHAHSQDNPEADWGRHIKQAAEFGLAMLAQAYPQAAPFRFDNTRVIAVGISNGGGAVLRAAELEGDWLDAVVAGEPNVQVEGAPSLYDYTTEAALLMPCAQLHLPADALPQPPLRAQVEPFWTARCASLKSAGLISGDSPQAQAASAYELMRAKGWTDAALTAGALSTGFDLWRAIAVTYASAYGRFGVAEHPCGFSFAAQNADTRARAATPAERSVWWSDGSGIPPGAGVGLIDGKLSAPDFTFNGLQCLRALNSGSDDAARRVQQGIAQVRAGMPRKGLPIIVVHGRDDGLIPPAFTSDPYVAQAKAAGSAVSYWQVQHAQHFDGFLALPAYGARYVPLLPYVYAALDRVSAQLDGQGAASDREIAAQPRGAGAVSAEQLQLPR